jgi:transposase
MWCRAELNEEYIAKMEDVLATYEKPLNEQEPVVCLDEKSVTLHEDVRAGTGMKPGHVAKRDYEYKRCGTANAFCAVEAKAGVHFTEITATRSAQEFAEVVKKIADHYTQAQRIHLVMDNLNTHTRKSLVACWGEEEGGKLWDRFQVHYTPKHGSWLNQAEIEISLFARQCLGRRRIGDRETLQAEAKSWNGHVNEKKVKINWTFDRKRARKKFGYQPKVKRSRN